MTSPITNCYETSQRWPKLKAETMFIYTPQTDWTFSHHPAISFFDGRFYAGWSNGRLHEDDPGQRVMYATAERFDQWSEPRLLAGAPLGKHAPEPVTLPCGYLAKQPSEFNLHVLPQNRAVPN